MRYWEMQSQKCERLQRFLNFLIMALSATVLVLGFSDTQPWLVPMGGLVISCLGFYIIQWRVAERAATAQSAHALWGAINDEYRRLHERCQCGEDITEQDLDGVVSQDVALSTVTRSTFAVTDKALVERAQDDRDRFFGANHASES